VIVLDASATVEMLLGTPLGERILDRVVQPGESLHAPHLLDVEVVSVFRRLLAVGQVADARATQAITDLSDLDLVRYPHGDLVMRAWTIRATVSAYDAMYVALGEALNAPVLTCDRRLARSHGHRATIEVLELVG
jgi:predicted nucleic acid-binding protein